MSNVVELPVITTLDIHPDKVLQGATSQLENVMVIGIKPDGTFYLASSKSHYGELLLLIEEARKIILNDYFHT